MKTKILLACGSFVAGFIMGMRSAQYTLSPFEDAVERLDGETLDLTGERTSVTF